MELKQLEPISLPEAWLEQRNKNELSETPGEGS